MKSKKGFTLIELLVVIAIIGILASIVLVSIKGAPAKAKDSKIKGDITQSRTIAEMINADDNDYSAFCDASNTLNDANTNYPQLKTLEDDIVSQFKSGTQATDVITCYATTDKYCVSAKLLSGKYFCVDSTGATSPPGGQTAVGCDNVNYDCAQ